MVHKKCSDKNPQCQSIFEYTGCPKKVRLEWFASQNYKLQELENNENDLYNADGMVKDGKHLLKASVKDLLR